MFGQKKRESLRVRLGATDALISKETKIRGSVNFTGALHVDGCVKGDIISNELAASLLTIGKNGYIEGEINVPYVVVFGKVKGDIHASERVELMPESLVEGDVYYKLIEMAMGAELNGKMLRKEAKQKLLNHQRVPDSSVLQQQVEDKKRGEACL